MAAVRFAEMPDDARVWVFGASEPIRDDAAARLRQGVEAFLAGWHAHGTPVVGAFDWRYDHFLIVAANERASGVSGCSIDSLYRTLRDLEQESGATLLDSAPVWYRDSAGDVTSVSRGEFRKLAEQEKVAHDTVVFDNTVATVGGIRSGEWERPLHESWHGRAFPVGRRAAS